MDDAIMACQLEPEMRLNVAGMVFKITGIEASSSRISLDLMAQMDTDFLVDGKEETIWIDAEGLNARLDLDPYTFLKVVK